MASYKVTFSPEAEGDLDSLGEAIRWRMIKKLRWFAAQNDPLSFARRLKDSSTLFRFRVGDYRIIFQFPDGIIDVLRIGHRSTIYR